MYSLTSKCMPAFTYIGSIHSINQHRIMQIPQLRPFNFRSCSSHTLISQIFSSQNLELYHVTIRILVRAISEVSHHGLVRLDCTSST